MNRFSRIVTLVALLGSATPCFSSAPRRIVSIAPSFTEILFALGLGDEIVGTSNYCDYPADAKNKPKVGDMMNPDVEKIIALRPDLVFAGHWKWEVPEKLRKVGIQVIEVEDAVTLMDSLDRIEYFGKQTGRAAQAAAIIASMQKRMDAIRERSRNVRPSPRVFVELDAGQWTVGGKSYINDVLETLGLENIFKDRPEPYLMVTLESIVSRSPDLLISLCRARSEYTESPAWSAVKAVRDGKIIDQHAMDWNAITHQGPRLVDGMEELEKLVRSVVATSAATPPSHNVRLRSASRNLVVLPPPYQGGGQEGVGFTAQSPNPPLAPPFIREGNRPTDAVGDFTRVRNLFSATAVR